MNSRCQGQVGIGHERQADYNACDGEEPSGGIQTGGVMLSQQHARKVMFTAVLLPGEG